MFVSIIFRSLDDDDDTKPITKKEPKDGIIKMGESGNIPSFMSS